MLWNLINTIIAGIGLLLVLMSLGWQFWTFHKTNSEQIKGKLFLTVDNMHGKNIPALKLEIWNAGNIPVYIKSVSLCWGNESNKLGDTVTQLIFKSAVSNEVPIKAGEGRTYLLQANHLFASANNQPQKKVWISVKSQKKEVLRITGLELKNYLSEIVKQMA